MKFGMRLIIETYVGIQIFISAVTMLDLPKLDILFNVHVRETQLVAIHYTKLPFIYTSTHSLQHT